MRAVDDPGRRAGKGGLFGLSSTGVGRSKGDESDLKGAMHVKRHTNTACDPTRLEKGVCK